MEHEDCESERNVTAARDEIMSIVDKYGLACSIELFHEHYGATLMKLATPWNSITRVHGGQHLCEVPENYMKDPKMVGTANMLLSFRDRLRMAAESMNTLLVAIQAGINEMEKLPKDEPATQAPQGPNRIPPGTTIH